MEDQKTIRKEFNKVMAKGGLGIEPSKIKEYVAKGFVPTEKDIKLLEVTRENLNDSIVDHWSNISDIGQDKTIKAWIIAEQKDFDNIDDSIHILKDALPKAEKNIIGNASKEFQEIGKPKYVLSLDSDKVSKIESDRNGDISIALAEKNAKEKSEYSHDIYENKLKGLGKKDELAEMVVDLNKDEILKLPKNELGITKIDLLPKENESIKQDGADYYVKVHDEDQELNAKAWSNEAGEKMIVVGKLEEVDTIDENGNNVKVKRLFLEKVDLAKVDASKEGYIHLSVRENLNGNLFIQSSHKDDDKSLINVSIDDDKIKGILESNPNQKHAVLDLKDKPNSKHEMEVYYYDFDKKEKVVVGNAFNLENKKIEKIDTIINKAFESKIENKEQLAQVLNKSDIKIQKADGKNVLVHQDKTYKIGSLEKAAKLTSILSQGEKENIPLKKEVGINGKLKREIIEGETIVSVKFKKEELNNVKGDHINLKIADGKIKDQYSNENIKLDANQIKKYPVDRQGNVGIIIIKDAEKGAAINVFHDNKQLRNAYEKVLKESSINIDNKEAVKAVAVKQNKQLAPKTENRKTKIKL
jgi:hypothetical protein